MQHDARLRSLTRNPPFRRGGQCPTTFVEHPSRCPHRQDKVAACTFARLTKTLFLIWECKTRTKTPFWTTSIPHLPTLGVCAISFFFLLHQQGRGAVVHCSSNRTAKLPKIGPFENQKASESYVGIRLETLTTWLFGTPVGLLLLASSRNRRQEEEKI